MWKAYDPESYNEYAKPMNDGLKTVNTIGNAAGGWNGIENAGQKMEKFVLLTLI